MKVETAAIKTVVPYARNPRKNEAAVAKVAASIKEFGWRQPIVVDSEMVVIAGHTRLEAARALGMAKVPIHVAKDFTPQQIKAYRIADNRVGQEAEWDEDYLALELLDLQEADFDLSLTGFDDDELGRHIGDAITSPDSGHNKLSDEFMVPPFSVINAREGWWQDRKRAWLALGIESEIGRGASPGGSARPAADYSGRQRGDSRGRAL